MSQVHYRGSEFTHDRAQRWGKEVLRKDKAFWSCSSLTIKPENLAAEFEVFINILCSDNESCNSARTACEFAYRKRFLFPAVYDYFKLLFIVPVTVAKNEKSYSKVKIIKIYMRSTMSGERLENLIVSAAEKDLTDTINLDVVVKA